MQAVIKSVVRLFELSVKSVWRVDKFNYIKYTRVHVDNYE